MIKKIYRGGDCSFELSELKITDYEGKRIELDSIQNLKIVFYNVDTDLSNYITFTKDDLTGGVLKLDNVALDKFNEGVLRYNITITLTDTVFDIVHDVQTEYFVARNEYTQKTTLFDNYYTKDEVDDIIDDIVISGGSVDLSNYYTKDEVDAKNYLTEQDISDLATIDSVNSGLSEKANTADVYNKTEVYTKTEVNDIVDDIVVSGSTDLTNYYTKTEVDDKIDKIVVNCGEF